MKLSILLLTLTISTCSVPVIAGNKKADKADKKEKDHKSSKKDKNSKKDKGSKTDAKDSSDASGGGILSKLAQYAKGINWTPCINKAKETLEAKMESGQADEPSAASNPTATSSNSASTLLESAVHPQETEEEIAYREPEE